MAQKSETRGEVIPTKGATTQTDKGKMTQVDWEVVENTVVVREEHWSWMSWRKRRERALAML